MAEILLGLTPLGLFALFLYAIAKWIKSFGNRGRYVSNIKPRAGIGGWLLLLIVSMVALAPIFGLGGNWKGFRDAELLYPSLADLREWKDFKSLSYVSVAVASAISIYGGWCLIRGKTRKAVRRAKTCLWASYAVLVCAIVVNPVITLGQGTLNSEDIAQLFRGLLSVIIWTLYLSWSKRVKATYPESSFNTQETFSDRVRIGPAALTPVRRLTKKEARGAGLPCLC